MDEIWSPIKLQIYHNPQHWLGTKVTRKIYDLVRAPRLTYCTFQEDSVEFGASMCGMDKESPWLNQTRFSRERRISIVLDRICRA